METTKMTRPVLRPPLQIPGTEEWRKEHAGFPPKKLTYLHGEWSRVGMNSLVVVESLRHGKKTGKESACTRSYISGLKSPAKAMERMVRKRRNVENNLHWTLDVEFMEDRCRKRRGNVLSEVERTCFSAGSNVWE